MAKEILSAIGAFLVAAGMVSCGGSSGGAGGEDLTCGAGESVCGSSCVDTSTSPTNCGACGNACTTAQQCITGHCATLFDSAPGLPGFSAGYGAGTGCGTMINVSSNVTMMGLDVYTALTTPGNIKLVVSDLPGHTILYASPPQPTGTGAFWKPSPPFTLALLAGHSYDVGFVSDQAWNAFYDTVVQTVGPIASTSTGPIFGNYASPQVTGRSTADCAIRFYFF